LLVRSDGPGLRRVVQDGGSLSRMTSDAAR
jgi:hypothetical protein